MKMHLLSCGRLRMRKSIFLPESDRSETIELPVSSALLRHGQANVLFDTGCHPKVAEDPEGRWGGLAKLMVPIMQPGEHVLTGLAELGLAPEDIDVVINSHLHPDHCGCNAFFRKATFLAHADELAAARAPGSEAAGYLAADWDQQMPFDEIAGQRDVFGDGRVVLLPLPGHTPGSIGALAQLEHSGNFLLAGDTVSLRETLDTDIVPRNTWNGEALLKSLAEVRRIEATGATIICSHDAEQWATLRKGADAYD
jgi:N-acyl homoserine lactone hydrolase